MLLVCLVRHDMNQRLARSLHTSVKIETDLHNVLLFQFRDILKLEEDIPHVREAAKVK